MDIAERIDELQEERYGVIDNSLINLSLVDSDGESYSLGSIEHVDFSRFDDPYRQLYTAVDSSIYIDSNRISSADLNTLTASATLVSYVQITREEYNSILDRISELETSIQNLQRRHI